MGRKTSDNATEGFARRSHLVFPDFGYGRRYWPRCVMAEEYESASAVRAAKLGIVLWGPASQPGRQGLARPA